MDPEDEPNDMDEACETIEALEAQVKSLYARNGKLRAALTEVNSFFVGREPDGSPSGDGTYWLGHTTALIVWEALQSTNEKVN